MKKMNDNGAAAAKEPELACTVLVAKTKIGGMLKGKGAKVRLPESQAHALAKLDPPRVSIEGV